MQPKLTTELPENYQCGDIRYEIGKTNPWRLIMGRELLELKDSKIPHEQTMCITRCIGFVEVERFIVAVVRQYWVNGYHHKDILRDEEIFHLEPVFYTTTGQYINDPQGVASRPGVTVNFSNSDNGIAFSHGYIQPEYEDLDWDGVVEGLKPDLTKELIEGEVMVVFAE